MSSTDLVQRVAEDLESRILNGQIAPGDRLPPERALGTQLGVSRSVVREAIKRLQSLGLVSSVQGSGTRVERPSRKPLIVGLERLIKAGEVRLEDVWQIRLPLETMIAGLAAQSRTDEDLRQLEGTQAVLADASATMDERVKADLLFHATLADATGNALFHIVLSPLLELLIESRRRTLSAFGASLAYEHHATILDAVRRQDSAAATAAMEGHLKVNYQHLMTLREQGESV